MISVNNVARSAVVAAMVLLAAGACQALPIANLSLEVDTVAKTWSAYLALSDPDNETLGLHGIYIDVWGSQTKFGPWTGGLAVNVGGTALPSGITPAFPTTPKSPWTIGFTSNPASSVKGTGIELMGVMQSNLHRERETGGATYNSILKGVGESAGSAPVSGGTIEWEYPVLVAEGEYTGDVGWLNVSLYKGYGGEVVSMTVLPATLPAATSTGAAFATFYPMAGENYRASVEVPEPATLALLAAGLGAIGLKRRKRA